jgi:hypothetical protein
VLKPVDTRVASAWLQSSKLKYDELTFAFNFDMRHYTEVDYVDTFRLLKLRYQQGQPGGAPGAAGEAGGAGGMVGPLPPGADDGGGGTNGAGAFGGGAFSREAVAAQRALAGGLLITSTRPTLILLPSCVYSARVCMGIHPEGISCSDLG